MLRQSMPMLLACALFIVSLMSTATPCPAQTSWVLSWSDEFNGPAGSPPEPAHWTYDVGGGGWGNDELEYYTNTRNNSYMDGHGNLVIKAMRDTTYAGYHYTSARLRTQGLFNQAYGRFEARMKIPHGQGLWPAYWMLGNDINTAGWPTCGEIDIMENIGKEPGTVHGSLHGPGYNFGAPYPLPGGTAFSKDFHVFAVEWEPTQIRWYVDHTLYETVNKSQLRAGQNWVFHHPFFIILNVAVGGNWPGSPDAATVFPQYLYIDYVRAYTAGTKAPAAPTQLTATAGSTRSLNIDLNWTQSTSSGITRNKVYRASKSGGPYTLIATLKPTIRYTNCGLSNGVTYYYVVTAVSSDGESAYSNQASATAR